MHDTCGSGCDLFSSTSDVPASGVYFGVYEYLLRTLTPEGQRYVCIYILHGPHDSVGLTSPSPHTQ